MKTLINLTVEGLKDEKGKSLDYAGAIKVCLQTPPLNNMGQPSGYTPEIMRDRINIQDKIDCANDKIELEDAEARTVVACVKETKWTKLDKSILKFIDDVEEQLK